MDEDSVRTFNAYNVY